MVFADFIQFTRTSPWQALITLIVIILLNIYLTAAVAPVAPGFGIVVSVIGALIGIGIGLTIAPKSVSV